VGFGWTMEAVFPTAFVGNAILVVGAVAEGMLKVLVPGTCTRVVVDEAKGDGIADSGIENGVIEKYVSGVRYYFIVVVPGSSVGGFL
jgi:hypothetical protein